MSKEGVYSIWLCPEGETGEKIQHVVDVLAKEFGVTSFKPHITIVPDREADLETLRNEVSDGAANTESLDLTFEGPSIGGSYYRCVYMLAKVTPELEKIYTDIRNKLGVTNLDIFPHMSLIYGDFDEVTKAAIAKRAEVLSNEVKLLPMNMTVTEITFYDTKKYVESGDRIAMWRYADKVRMGKN